MSAGEVGGVAVGGCWWDGWRCGGGRGAGGEALWVSEKEKTKTASAAEGVRFSNWLR